MRKSEAVAKMFPVLTDEEAAVIARAEREPAYIGAREVRILLGVIHREIRDAKAFAEKVGIIAKAEGETDGQP